MSFGLSKSFGGVRFTYRPTRERQPTQAEIAQADKEQFLDKVDDIATNSWLYFLGKIGYSTQTVLYAKKTLNDFSDFIADEEVLAKFYALASISLQLRTELNKIRFSNVLRSKKRETLTDYVFQIYAILDSLYPMYNDEQLLKKVASVTNKTYDEVLVSRNEFKESREGTPLSKKLYRLFFLLGFIGIVVIANKEDAGPAEYIITFLCFMAASLSKKKYDKNKTI